MARCDVCGNEYDKAFTITKGGQKHTFDSFECAIHAGRGHGCPHCGCKVIGHGVECDDVIFCLRELCQTCRRRIARGSRVSLFEGTGETPLALKQAGDANDIGRGAGSVRLPDSDTRSRHHRGRASGGTPMGRIGRLTRQEPRNSTALTAQVQALARPLRDPTDLDPLLERIGDARVRPARRGVARHRRVLHLADGRSAAG